MIQCNNWISNKLPRAAMVLNKNCVSSTITVIHNKAAQQVVGTGGGDHGRKSITTN